MIQLSSDQYLQQCVLAPTNSKFFMQLTLKNTKDGLRSHCTHAAVAPKPYVGHGALVPCVKRRHPSPSKTNNQTPEERRQNIYNRIRPPPRPMHDRLYFVEETINVFNALCSKNVWHVSRTFATLVKQHMINGKYDGATRSWGPIHSTKAGSM